MTHKKLYSLPSELSANEESTFAAQAIVNGNLIVDFPMGCLSSKHHFSIDSNPKSYHNTSLQAVNQEKINYLFLILDQDQDRFLNRQQANKFLTVLLGYEIDSASQKLISNFFRIVDPKGNGRIEKKELSILLYNIILVENQKTGIN